MSVATIVTVESSPDHTTGHWLTSPQNRQWSCAPLALKVVAEAPSSTWTASTRTKSPTAGVVEGMTSSVITDAVAVNVTVSRVKLPLTADADEVVPPIRMRTATSPTGTLT